MDYTQRTPTPSSSPNPQRIILASPSQYARAPLPSPSQYPRASVPSPPCFAPATIHDATSVDGDDISEGILMYFLVQNVFSVF